MRIALGFTLLLAACGGHAAQPTTPPPATPPPETTPVVATPPPAPASTDCAIAVNFVMDQMAAPSQAQIAALPPEQRKGPEEMLDRMLPKMKAVTADACIIDKWSPEMIRCTGTSKTEADFSKCADLLTEDQKTHVQAELSKVMNDGGASDSPPPGP